MSAHGTIETPLSGINGTAGLEYTGERIVPGRTEEGIFCEHEERYVFAGLHVKNKEVLDVACGSGIGTDYLLKAGAIRSSGIDMDAQAIRYARANYQGCAFVNADATQTGFLSNSFDVVVSFETIEHLENQRGFLRECYRILRPGGLLICSTPNSRITRWSAKNPFHLRELNPGEFEVLLRSVFPSVDMYGQRDRIYLLYSLRMLTVRVLKYFRLTRIIRRFLPNDSVTAHRRIAFERDRCVLAETITRFSPGVLIEPTYVIGIARKN